MPQPAVSQMLDIAFASGRTHPEDRPASQRSRPLVHDAAPLSLLKRRVDRLELLVLTSVVRPLAYIVHAATRMHNSLDTQLPHQRLGDPSYQTQEPLIAEQCPFCARRADHQGVQPRDDAVKLLHHIHVFLLDLRLDRR